MEGFNPLALLRVILEYCELDGAVEGLVKMAIAELGLSVRLYDHTHWGRTIADIARSSGIWPGYITQPQLDSEGVKFSGI